MRIVTYENRLSDIVGLKLLILSLHNHCPELPVDVFFPNAPEAFAHWLAQMPQVSLHRDIHSELKGYDVKPLLLARALDAGAEQAVWIDTDIIVTRNFQNLFAQIPASHVVVSQEWFGAPYQGGNYRSRAWGLPLGRSLNATTNTAVIRVTPEHRELLHSWQTLLYDHAYAAAQSRHWSERPIHLQGDQEVLAALLESKTFAHVPIRYLYRGHDIIHCFQHQGYPVHQVVSNIVTHNIPWFVHGQGAKPWRDNEAFQVHLDTSPYTLCAAEYAASIDENMDWLVPRSRAGKWMRSVFHDNPWSTSLPWAFFEEMRNQRGLRTIAKKVMGKP